VKIAKVMVYCHFNEIAHQLNTQDFKSEKKLETKIKTLPRVQKNGNQNENNIQREKENGNQH